MTTFIAIQFENGDIGRMQHAGKPADEEIQESVDKLGEVSVSKPVGWTRVSADAFPKDKAEWAKALSAPTS